MEVQNEAEDFSLTAESLNFTSIYEHLIKIEDKYMLLLPEGHNMLDLSPERDKQRLCGCLKPMGIELMHTPDEIPPDSTPALRRVEEEEALHSEAVSASTSSEALVNHPRPRLSTRVLSLVSTKTRSPRKTE